MYPVGLCLHILLDASVCLGVGFLVGPLVQCAGAFGFLFSKILKVCSLAHKMSKPLCYIL